MLLHRQVWSLFIGLRIPEIGNHATVNIDSTCVPCVPGVGNRPKTCGQNFEVGECSLCSSAIIGQIYPNTWCIDKVRFEAIGASRLAILVHTSFDGVYPQPGWKARERPPLRGEEPGCHAPRKARYGPRIRLRLVLLFGGIRDTTLRPLSPHPQYIIPSTTLAM